MSRFLVFLIVALLAPSAVAQTNGAEEPAKPAIVIESFGEVPDEEDEEDEARTAGPALERIKRTAQSLEKSADPQQVLDDHAWVQETIRASGPLVHGLQRYTRLNEEDVVPRWRAAVRLQAAAHEAFRARKYHTAVYLTLKARETAREGYEIANVTRAKTVEDTPRQKEYAAKSNASQAQPFYEIAMKALPDSELDPGKSPHEFRTQPIQFD